MTTPIDVSLAAVDAAVSALRAARAAHPGRSVVFPILGDAAMRRQIVRWIGVEYEAPTPGILEVLRTALDDDDWEVRASAMIVAARLHAVSLHSAVRESSIPHVGQFGLDEFDVRCLTGMRFMAATLLRAAAVHETARNAVRADFPLLDTELAVLRGGSVPQPTTRAQLFLYALTLPSPLRDPLPDCVPPGVDVREGRPYLVGTDIALVWMAAGACLLGGDVLPNSATSAVRPWTMPHGVFVAQRPLTATDIAPCDVTPPEGAPLENDAALRLRLMTDPPLLLAHDTAATLCDALGMALQASVMLPSADELEAVVRGRDGRRYPWGNGLQRLTGREQSPTLLERFVAPASQWTRTVDAQGRPVALGGPASPYCAARSIDMTASAVRVAIPVN